jgi:DNA-binding NtrC family response regulator
MPGSIITLADLPVELHLGGERQSEQGQLSPPAPQAPRVSRHSSGSPEVGRQPLAEESAGHSATGGALKEQSNSAEMQAIIDALHSSDGQVTRAAGLLSISRTTLWRKMAKYGLK